jgi:hypothetical protein
MSITYNQQLCYVVPKKPYTLAGRSPSAIIWREILARNFGAKFWREIVARNFGAKFWRENAVCRRP